MGMSGWRYQNEDTLGRTETATAVEISAAHRYQVLAVDDQAEILTALRRLLRSRGFDIHPFTDPHEALAALGHDPYAYDLLILDINMPSISGLELLPRVKEIAPELPVIMLTADDRIQTAVAALKAGAFNYLTKPLQDPDEVSITLTTAGSYGLLQRRARDLQHKLSLSDRFPRMVGESAPMRELFARIEKVAETDSGVLIRGDSGTGKELVAREIHERSTRSRGPYVTLNCGAIPETLIDSELFGHVKGAFTGAITSKIGVFGQANQGTLFLDEIGELPLNVQPRLLRVLQEGEVRPVGSSVTRPVDVRVIAATHMDLDAAVAKKVFRADLFYRLNIVTLDIPPLRQRMDDLPLLAKHLLEKHSAKNGRSVVPHISQAAMHAMSNYAWPGNVRELENAIQHVLAMIPGNDIDVDVLPPRIAASTGRGGTRVSADGSSAPAKISPEADAMSWADDMPFQEAKKRAQSAFEVAYLTRLLHRTQGNVSEAARCAGLDRSNFRRLLGRLAIDPDAYRTA